MIRQALSQDAKALWHLEQTLFDSDNFPLSLASFYYHIKRNMLLIVEHDGEIMGYCLWLKRPKRYRLYSIGVSPLHRGKGIAKELLEYSFAHLQAQTFTLEVRSDNRQAIALYEKYGFTIDKLLKEYYPNQMDGYKMIKRD
ncbi:MAG: GNAT family N-acetyltransferase [Campylobacterales bacterium]|nr:GNAT family N-acetyltransferase [Campylobacterales bacterium]